jgi:hypothetical protein
VADVRFPVGGCCDSYVFPGGCELMLSAQTLYSKRRGYGVGGLERKFFGRENQETRDAAARGYLCKGCSLFPIMCGMRTTTQAKAKYKKGKE